MLEQVAVPVEFDNVRLDCGYRVDLLVEDEVVVELKSVERLLPIHSAQALTYMRLAGVRHALLINFNVELLKNGVRSFVNPACRPGNGP
jgi:GxxExxY protein